mgnify:CR=1 FL=1
MTSKGEKLLILEEKIATCEDRLAEAEAEYDSVSYCIDRAKWIRLLRIKMLIEEQIEQYQDQYDAIEDDKIN